MKSMRVADGETPASQAAKFAEQLHDDWGVGDEECNNGVLLLLAIQERQVCFKPHLFIVSTDSQRSIVSINKQPGVLHILTQHVQRLLFAKQCRK